jgi:UrcA family protein
MLTTIQIRVSSKGLDLTTEAGATQFLDRLSRAASAACGGYPDPSPIITDAPRRFRLCREKAVAGAVAQSQSELLKRQLTIREADGKVRMARR